MTEQDSFEPAMLSEAMMKAQRLVDELKKTQAETEAAPPNLPADQRAQGRQALEMAIQSAQRMLHSLHEAASVHPANQDVSPA